MIINYKEDAERAALYDLIDLDTGRPPDALVWYADDDAGFYRAYQATRLEPTGWVLALASDGEPISYDVPARLRIALKPDYATEDEGLAFHRVDQRRYHLGRYDEEPPFWPFLRRRLGGLVSRILRRLCGA
jgi:hypothetical protein